MLLAAVAVALGQVSAVVVTDDASLRQALQNAGAGRTVLLAPGRYRGGVFPGVRGEPGRPVVVAGQDPNRPPEVVSLQFQDPVDLEVRDLVLNGPAGNAINIDDGGTRETPARRITLRNLRISGVEGSGANGIKMAGVDGFRIENCTIEGYGGCGIDFVGCHRGFVVGGRIGPGKGVGVQAKGASSEIVIRQVRFRDYGERGVNLGGSTGPSFFRPRLESVPAGQRVEAKILTVEGSTFIGGTAPFAFVGVDGAVVRFNTVFVPNRWGLRILQETGSPDFVSSRRGRVEDNLFVFRSDRWFEGGVNIGRGTAPATFTFARNFWFCLDQPDRSQPRLPTPEVGGVYGIDPKLNDPGAGDFGVSPGSPAARVGAHAFRP